MKDSVIKGYKMSGSSITLSDSILTMYYLSLTIYNNIKILDMYHIGSSKELIIKTLFLCEYFKIKRPPKKRSIYPKYL